MYPGAIDLSSKLNPNCFTVGRGGQQILGVGCHDTSGPYDKGQGTPQTSVAAANYLTDNDRQVSIHYYIGAEVAGAPIYSIVPEGSTAYHIGGNPPYAPSYWRDPTTGQGYGAYALNEVFLGIELYGQPEDQIGPLQVASIKKLVRYLATEYPILRDPRRWESHKNCEPIDRRDGPRWRDIARAEVLAMQDDQVLPYGATWQGDQSLAFPVGNNTFVIANGFLQYFLTLGGNCSKDDIRAAIYRGVKFFGLPKESEQPTSTGASQKFERYTLEFTNDPKLGDWQIHGKTIN